MGVANILFLWNKRIIISNPKKFAQSINQFISPHVWRICIQFQMKNIQTRAVYVRKIVGPEKDRFLQSAVLTLVLHSSQEGRGVPERLAPPWYDESFLPRHGLWELPGAAGPVVDFGIPFRCEVPVVDRGNNSNVGRISWSWMSSALCVETTLLLSAQVYYRVQKQLMTATMGNSA